jgi:hypothetical protein
MMADDPPRVTAVSDVFFVADGTVRRGAVTIEDTLRNRRRDVFEQARELVRSIEYRQFTPDEQNRWNRLSAELEALDARIARIRSRR